MKHTQFARNFYKNSAKINIFCKKIHYFYNLFHCATNDGFRCIYPKIEFWVKKPKTLVSGTSPIRH